jgi:hypothetical protein
MKQHVGQYRLSNYDKHELPAESVACAYSGYNIAAHGNTPNTTNGAEDTRLNGDPQFQLNYPRSTEQLISGNRKQAHARGKRLTTGSNPVTSRSRRHAGTAGTGYAPAEHTSKHTAVVQYKTEQNRTLLQLSRASGATVPTI